MGQSRSLLLGYKANIVLELITIVTFSKGLGVDQREEWAWPN